MEKWIETDDMLPGFHRHVLLFIEDSTYVSYTIGYLESNGEFYYWVNTDLKCVSIKLKENKKVTHWMELPGRPY